MEAPPHSLSYNESTTTSAAEAKEEAEAFISQNSDSADQTEATMTSMETPRDHPLRWSIWYKRYLTVLTCVILFILVTLTSEALFVFVHQLEIEYKMGGTLVQLTIASFGVCFCVGPLLWAPLSEQFGRRPVFLFCFMALPILQVGVALSQNSTSIVLFRILSGLLGSAILPLAPAIIADIWDVDAREKEMGTYIFNIMSPSSGAVFGVALLQKDLGWRDSCWVLAVIAGICSILVVLTFHETRRSPVVVDDGEEQANKDDSEYRTTTALVPAHTGSAPATQPRTWQQLAKPYVLLHQEPLLVMCTIYLALVGVSVNILFKVIPVAFQGYTSAVPQKLGGLIIILGSILGHITHNVLLYPRLYLPRARQYAPARVPPELRLSLAIWAAPLFALSFIWFGWTASPHIHAAVPLLAAVFIGMSAMWIMQVTMNYVVDLYQDVVASALAWYIVTTYILTTITSVYSVQLFRTLSPRWIMTLVGCVGVAIVPIPILLRRFGPALRAKSRQIR
ncbi:major facilitator superfamily domain-containing protein [Earliella scabrosa]|nr:major facilitator superfamily domain-containing protein [Earliella scabrosa]